MQKEYPKGLYYDLPREGAPEFVLGKLSIKKEELLEWLHSKEANQKGYINLDILMGQATAEKPAKPYIAVNDYKPKN